MSDDERCDDCGGRWDRPGRYRCDDPRHATPTPARRIVADIERELHGRGNVGWQGVGDVVADEIRDRLAEIVEGHLTRAKGGTS